MAVAHMIAIDVSNFSGKFSDEQAKQMRDVARRIIINTHDLDIAVDQGVVAGRNCLERQLYSQLYFSVSFRREIDKAVSVRDALGLSNTTRLWLACEDEISGLHEEYVDAWLWKHIVYATECGFESIGIYTRAEWWLRMFRSLASKYAAMGFPLWLADYDLKPVLEASNPIPGWQHEMKQYDGWAPGHEVWLAGVRVDLNVY